jgi:nucleotide-binding universal stress UspA family protein
MYKSILVPLDGSPFTEYALPLAKSIAHRSGAMLDIARVHIPGKSLFIIDEALEDSHRKYEREYLNAVVKRLTTDSGISVTSALLGGKIANALNDHAVAINADLIVMTTHGQGTRTRFWLGSVADELVRKTAKPILLVRPSEGIETPPDLTQEPVLRRILIPLDGSELSEQILRHAMVLGNLMQAQYTLIQVIEPIIPASYERTAYSIKLEHEWIVPKQAEAETYLDSITKRIRASAATMPLQIETKVLISERPAIAILEEASESRIDLIAMGTHGRGGLTRLLVGSVADKVLRGAPIPVLLHRPLEASFVIKPGTII